MILTGELYTYPVQWFNSCTQNIKDVTSINENVNISLIPHCTACRDPVPCQHVPLHILHLGYPHFTRGR